jgi:hypothetical protein
MVCNGKDYPDYSCIGWLQLRAEIVERDGHVCRNCGYGEGLQVHHCLPLAEYADQVDHLGYAKGKCPLRVHTSGLITLCAECHREMTERRRRRALHANRRLRTMSGDEAHHLHNIFELWALNGETVPFKVFRYGWSKMADHYYLVEKLEIRKWPYGTAWGTYYRNGEPLNGGKIAGAGTYRWQYVP